MVLNLIISLFCWPYICIPFEIVLKLYIFSCPEQLNRWPTDWVTSHWLEHMTSHWFEQDIWDYFYNFNNFWQFLKCLSLTISTFSFTILILLNYILFWQCWHFLTILAMFFTNQCKFGCLISFFPREFRIFSKMGILFAPWCYNNKTNNTVHNF